MKKSIMMASLLMLTIQAMALNPWKKGAFETEILDGMLELINITGNIITDDDQLFHHTHAVFSFKSESEHKIAAGHMKALTVLYTAEIELRPVIGGVIKRKQDPETGTGFWSFE